MAILVVSRYSISPVCVFRWQVTVWCSSKIFPLNLRNYDRALKPPKSQILNKTVQIRQYKNTVQKQIEKHDKRQQYKRTLHENINIGKYTWQSVQKAVVQTILSDWTRWPPVLRTPLNHMWLMHRGYCQSQPAATLLFQYSRPEIQVTFLVIKV